MDKEFRKTLDERSFKLTIEFKDTDILFSKIESKGDWANRIDLNIKDIVFGEENKEITKDYIENKILEFISPFDKTDLGETFSEVDTFLNDIVEKLNDDVEDDVDDTQDTQVVDSQPTDAVEETVEQPAVSPENLPIDEEQLADSPKKADKEKPKFEFKRPSTYESVMEFAPDLEKVLKDERLDVQTKLDCISAVSFDARAIYDKFVSENPDVKHFKNPSILLEEIIKDYGNNPVLEKTIFYDTVAKSNFVNVKYDFYAESMKNNSAYNELTNRLDYSSVKTEFESRLNGFEIFGSKISTVDGNKLLSIKGNPVIKVEFGEKNVYLMLDGSKMLEGIRPEWKVISEYKFDVEHNKTEIALSTITENSAVDDIIKMIDSIGMNEEIYFSAKQYDFNEGYYYVSERDKSFDVNNLELNNMNNDFEDVAKDCRYIERGKEIFISKNFYEKRLDTTARDTAYEEIKNIIRELDQSGLEKFFSSIKLKIGDEPINQFEDVAKKFKYADVEKLKKENPDINKERLDKAKANAVKFFRTLDNAKTFTSAEKKFEANLLFKTEALENKLTTELDNLKEKIDKQTVGTKIENAKFEHKLERVLADELPLEEKEFDKDLHSSVEQYNRVKIELNKVKAEKKLIVDSVKYHYDLKEDLETPKQYEVIENVNKSLEKTGTDENPFLDDLEPTVEPTVEPSDEIVNFKDNPLLLSIEAEAKKDDLSDMRVYEVDGKYEFKFTDANQNEVIFNDKTILTDETLEKYENLGNKLLNENLISQEVKDNSEKDESEKPDLTSDELKNVIKDKFDQAIDRLTDEDKQVLEEKEIDIKDAKSDFFELLSKAKFGETNEGFKYYYVMALEPLIENDMIDSDFKALVLEYGQLRDYCDKNGYEVKFANDSGKISIVDKDGKEVEDTKEINDVKEKIESTFRPDIDVIDFTEGGF